MKVYVVLDNSKECYDAGGIYYGVFATRKDAEESLKNFSKFDRTDFEIEEEI